jgi:hypothetical protein
MLERINPILRLVCLALAGVIAYQVSQLAFKRNTLAHGNLSIAPIHLKDEKKKETNAAPAETKSSTNAPSTNVVAASAPPPDMTPPPEMAMSLPPGITLPPGVTLPPGAMAAMRSSRSRAGGPSGPPGLTGAMMMRGGPGGMPANLPPEIAAMVEKIKTSQILGPDVKPPPMALLGIAGKDVFLRAPNGQTGILREGEDLGGVKLIRVGTNRVIVEENKQQKELTIFEGFGGQTLLKKDKQ